MNEIELAFQEFKIANERDYSFREYKLKIISIAIPIILGVITFTAKGDLPQILYLVVAITLFGTIVLVNYQTYKHVIYGNIATLAEQKLNLIKNKEKQNTGVLTYFKNYNLLVDADYDTSKSKSFVKRIRSLILLVMLIALFEFMLYLGSVEFNTRIRLLIHLISYVLIITYSIISIQENKNRRSKFEKMAEKLKTVYND
jgi:hypothetical protein